MPKILYIVTKSEWGGAQKYVYDLAVALKNEFQVLVASGEGNGELFDKLSEAGIRWVKLENLRRLPSPLQALKAVWEIKKLLQTERPDILHLNSTTAGFLASLAVKSERGLTPLQSERGQTPLRTVYTVHGWAFLEPGLFRKIVFFLAEKLTAVLKDKFIVLSQYEKKIGLQITKKEKMIVIPNGLKNLQFDIKEEAKKKLGLNPRERFIGTIANLYKTKGLKYLSQTGLKNIIVIGEGPERKHLKNLQLLGKVPEAWQYLRAFDIFCLPSVKEGFPWVLLEAMQAGLPIVATKVGAIQEMLTDKKEALLVEPKNSKAIAKALGFLLQNKTKAQELSQKAKTKASQFSFEKMLSQTKIVYHELLIN